ncbi:hypothetical protein MXB_4577 [Myxobolus squamalis]|nr:hypothetical protein MXB_4577 [Myxobolus squamalis]
MIKYGRRAGTFISLGNMNFEKCANNCCEGSCDALLHFNSICYKIICNNAQYELDQHENEGEPNFYSSSCNKLQVLRPNHNTGVIIILNLLLTQPPEEDMNAAKDILLPLILGVQIGKIGSLVNEAGLTLSQQGFEVSSSKGSSLICLSLKEFSVQWPVAVINTSVHVGCPKNAKGLAYRFCSDYNYWQRPIFRNCYSKEYQEIQKMINFTPTQHTSAIDKLLQLIASDTQTEPYSRKFRRSVGEETDSDIEQDSSDVLSRVFGSLGDVNQFKTDNIDSNVLSSSAIESQYPSAFYSSSVQREKYDQNPKSIIVENIKEYAFPVSAQKPEYKVFSTYSANSNGDSWFYGMMGGDIDTTVNIIDKIAHSESTLSTIDIKEWIQINSKQEDEQILFKLIISLTEITEKALSSKLDDVIPISYNILRLPITVVHPRDKLNLVDYQFTVEVDSTASYNNIECYTFDHKSNKLALKLCNAEYNQSVFNCRCKYPGPLMYRFQQQHEIIVPGNNRNPGNMLIGHSSYTTESESSFPSWAIIVIILLILFIILIVK